jgi:hypothetical protein
LGPAEVAALKYNADGNLDWAKSWTYGYGAQASYMSRAPDGKLWFAGVTRQTEVSAEQALLLSLDPITGNLLSASTLGGAYDDYFSSVAVAADGTLHACGGTYAQPNPSDPNAFYAVVDSGALVSAKAWGCAGVDEYFSISVLDSSNAVFLGGQGKTPATGSWADVAATYEAGVSGTLNDAGTTLKNLHGTLSDITGTLLDVVGIEDADTGDNANVLACKPQ